jgi:hypothetical protein
MVRDTLLIASPSSRSPGKASADVIGEVDEADPAVMCNLGTAHRAGYATCGIHACQDLIGAMDVFIHPTMVQRESVMGRPDGPELLRGGLQAQDALLESLHRAGMVEIE